MKTFLILVAGGGLLMPLALTHQQAYADCKFAEQIKTIQQNMAQYPTTVIPTTIKGKAGKKDRTVNLQCPVDVDPDVAETKIWGLAYDLFADALTPQNFTKDCADPIVRLLAQVPPYDTSGTLTPHYAQAVKALYRPGSGLLYDAMQRLTPDEIESVMQWYDLKKSDRSSAVCPSGMTMKSIKRGGRVPNSEGAPPTDLGHSFS